MVELKSGVIYLYKKDNFTSLIRIERLEIESMTIKELASTHKMNTGPILLDNFFKHQKVMEEVKLEDLPLYLYMTEKSPEFLELLRLIFVKN